MKTISFPLPRLRICRFLATPLTLLLQLTGSLEAALSESLQSIAIGNPSSYIIASDANNADPLYNRDSIQTEVTVQYSRSGGSSYHWLYRFDYQLVDEDGLAQTLNLGGGQTGTTLQVYEDVDMTGGLAVISRKTTGYVRPANRLNPYKNHHVTVTVYKRQQPIGLYQLTALNGQTTPQKYKHFNQLISGDSPYNVITELQALSWGRDYRVQSEAARDHFRLNASIRLYRYDNFGSAAASADITTRFSVVMRDDQNNVIPLEQSTFEFVNSVPSYVEGNLNVADLPSNVFAARALEIRPVGQLPSRSRTYTLQVTVGHYETSGAQFATAGNNLTTADKRLLDFNGNIAFAGQTASFTSTTTPGPAADALGTGYVLTTLRINNNSGSFKGLTFGNGDPLAVRLDDNGLATLDSGTISFNGTTTPQNPGKILYTLSSLIASPTGFTGTINLRLPAGMGYGVDSNTRIHEPNIFFFNVPLGSGLSPVAASLTSNSLRWISEESKPFIFESSSLTWDVQLDRMRAQTTGQVLWVRAKAYDQLFADNSVPGNLRYKLANDGYYWKMSSMDSAEVLIEPDPVNGSALMTCDVKLGGSLYRGHFPYNVLVSATGGSQRIVQDKVDPSSGGLTGAGTVQLAYRRDCPDQDCDGAAGLQTIGLVPDGALIKFTRDGGLAASGLLSDPLDLSWGWVETAGDFAQAATTFLEGGFVASGYFLAGDQYATDAPLQPARMLLSGIDPNQADVVERAGSQAYTAGLGDYPGFNFRVFANGEQNGKMVLAGQPSDPFPLTNRAKYYVRYAGVSGIHEAINGQFNPTAVIYGMDFTFTTLGWAFLDSQAVDSRTAGGLSVPYPSDFDLAFERLMISCQGALLGAEIAAADAGSLKKLSYWNADFRPLTMGFEGKEDNFCDPGNRRLVLGVEAYAGGIPQPLSGKIGFQTNGNLVTLASGDLDPPFDSRLTLPNSFEIAGPGSQIYKATPVGDAYLNDYAVLPEGFGWMNIAAHINVPFFEDLQIHLHTSALKDDPDPLIYMMGGYPNLGFAANGKHFFNESVFDVSNRGFPLDVTLEEYRQGLPDPDEKYRPRAQTRWLGVVDFDYPLEWRPASKSFVSFKEISNSLLILYAQHRIDYLSAEQVEVTFGAGFSTLPTVNLSNFVADKATDVTAILQDYLQTEVVDAGVQGLNDILDVKQREFFELVLEPAIDQSVDAVMDALTANWNIADKQWNNPDIETIINGAVFDPVAGVFKKVDDALKAAKTASGVLQQVDLRLEQADNALDQIEAFIEEKEGAPLGNMEDVVLGLAGLVSQALDKPEFAQKIDEILRKAEPRIIEVRNAIGEVRAFISNVRERMGEAGAFTNQIVDTVDSNAGSIQAEVNKIRDEIVKIVDQVQPGVDSLAGFETALREKMKQRILDYIIGLPVIREYNRLLKQQLYDVASLLTQAIDEVFDQINLTLRDIIKDVVGGLEEKFEEMLGDVSSVMATANINGYAKIRNDSLTELRLDLKAAINVPDEMKANVFILIKELNSDNFPAECLNGTEGATEVTMGAKDVSVEWLFPDVSLNISAKFVIDGTGGFPLLGMGGGIDLVGEISFADSIIIHQLGASVMFGKFENYISAGVALEVQGFQGGGGIFFGRACSLDPFFWDTLVAEVIGTPPFTGFYGYGEFWIPINQLIGIPSTCLFNLSAGVGAGAGVFAEGPTVFGKMFLGVSGDLLCIVSVTGEISLVGVARPSGLSLAGEGRFTAEIGYCPVCLKFDKSARLVKEGKKWSRSVK